MPLPLDDETRAVLRRWSRGRPQSGVPWVVLAWTAHAQLRWTAVTQGWTAAVHPESADSETNRAVTSHSGRHRFTTDWTVQRDLTRELVTYRRGDTPGSADIDERGAGDESSHSDDADVDYQYREQIYGIGCTTDER